MAITNEMNTEKMLAPVVALNKIALAKTEKLVDLQIAAVRKYAEVALASWKDALTAKDPAELQKYVVGQGEVAKDVVENILKDAKTVAELGQETAQEVQKLMSENLAKATKKAA
ncbi:MAG: TIGR01841 family phasin [Gammaproteobacteria bacterium]|nr:TIGR01841 family phasin [Gammaproteobacteria bacterium]